MFSRRMSRILADSSSLLGTFFNSAGYWERTNSWAQALRGTVVKIGRSKRQEHEQNRNTNYSPVVGPFMTRPFFFQISKFSEILNSFAISRTYPNFWTCSLLIAEHLERVHVRKVGNLYCRNALIAISMFLDPKIWKKIASIVTVLRTEWSLPQSGEEREDMNESIPMHATLHTWHRITFCVPLASCTCRVPCHLLRRN